MRLNQLSLPYQYEVGQPLSNQVPLWLKWAETGARAAHPVMTAQAAYAAALATVTTLPSRFLPALASLPGKQETIVPVPIPISASRNSICNRMLRFPQWPTDQLVVLLIQERDRIQRAIDALEAPAKNGGGAKEAVGEYQDCIFPVVFS